MTLKEKINNILSDAPLISPIEDWNWDGYPRSICRITNPSALMSLEKYLKIDMLIKKTSMIECVDSGIAYI